MKDNEPSSHFQQSLTKMAGIIAIGRLVALSITVMLPLLLVRIFDNEMYGSYKQIFLIADTLVPLLGFSLGKNVLYFFPRKSEERKTITFNILLIYLFIGIFAFLLFTFYPEMINLLFKGNAIAGFMPSIGIYVAISLLASFFEEVTIANGEIKLTSVILVLTNSLQSIFLIVAALIVHNLYSLIFAAIIFSVLRLIFFLFYLSKRFKGLPYAFNIKLLKEQFLYTLPFGINGFIMTIRRSMHFFFVSSFSNPGIFATYAVGAFQIPFLHIVNYSISNILIAEMSKLQANGEIEKIKIILGNSIRKISLIYGPLFFLLLILRKEFVIALFTIRYTESIPLFTVNLLSILLLIPLIDPIFRAFTEYRYFRLRVSFLGISILPFILFIFYKEMGLIGVVLGNILVNLITQTILLLKSFKILRFSSSEIFLLFSRVGKIFLVSAAACLPIILFKYLIQLQTALYVLLVSTIIYAIAYVLLVYCFNLITKDEKKEIKDYLLNCWNQYGFGKLAK